MSHTNIFVYLLLLLLFFCEVCKKILLLQNRLEIMELLEPALRVQVLVAQAQAGMWRRNGFSLLNQVSCLFLFFFFLKEISLIIYCFICWHKTSTTSSELLINLFNEDKNFMSSDHDAFLEGTGFHHKDARCVYLG